MIMVQLYLSTRTRDHGMCRKIVIIIDVSQTEFEEVSRYILKLAREYLLPTLNFLKDV